MSVVHADQPARTEAATAAHNEILRPLLEAAGWTLIDQYSGAVGDTSLPGSQVYVWAAPGYTSFQDPGGPTAKSPQRQQAFYDVPVQADGVSAETDIAFDNGLWDFEGNVTGTYYSGMIVAIECQNAATMLMRFRATEQYADANTAQPTRFKYPVNGTNSNSSTTPTANYAVSESWLPQNTATVCYIGAHPFAVGFPWMANITPTQFMWAPGQNVASLNYFVLIGKPTYFTGAYRMWEWPASTLWMGGTNSGTSHSFAWTDSNRGSFRSSRGALNTYSAANPFAFGADWLTPSVNQRTTNTVDTTYFVFGLVTGGGGQRAIQPRGYSHAMAGQMWLWSYNSQASGRFGPVGYWPDIIIYNDTIVPSVHQIAAGREVLRKVSERDVRYRHYREQTMPMPLVDAAVGAPPVEDNDNAWSEHTPSVVYYTMGLVDNGTGSPNATSGGSAIAMKG